MTTSAACALSRRLNLVPPPLARELAACAFLGAVEADLALVAPAHLGGESTRIVEVEIDRRAGLEAALAFDHGAAGGDVAQPHGQDPPLPVDRAVADQAVARGPGEADHRGARPALGGERQRLVGRHRPPE